MEIYFILLFIFEISTGADGGFVVKREGLVDILLHQTRLTHPVACMNKIIINNK